MKVAYNLRMEKDLKERLEKEAREANRSFNNLVNHILADYVARRLVKRYWKEKEDDRA